MYLSQVYIKNFRSIKSLNLRLNKGKNVIIGRNNAGKSNLVAALNLILGESSPDYHKSDNVTETDFYTEKDKDGTPRTENNLLIWCALTREPDEAIDYEECYKCFGYYVKTDGQYDLSNLDLNLASIFEVEENSGYKKYVNPKLKNQQTFEAELDDKYQFAFAFQAKRTESGIEKSLRFLYRKNGEDSWFLAFKASIRNALMQSAIIPTFRDPQSQLRINQWSWYGKLLKHLTDDRTNAAKVKNAFSEVRSVANEIFKSAQEKIAESALNVSFPGTELSFQFGADEPSDIYKSCLIYIDDGFRSLLTEKGSGIQSTTIIGLFRYYTSEVNIKVSALLCVEEPELYLHPHARRVISDRLDEFLNGNRNQVIITTHSVEFIRGLTPDTTLILASKSASTGTTACSISLDRFKNLLRDNNQNEIFFADKVIICEGFDEYVLRAAAKELFPGRLDALNVSIVAVSGKDNIAKLAKLILGLGIQVFVLADFDYFLRDKDEKAKTYGAKQHESIVSLGVEFFKQECLFADRGQTAFNYIQKIRSEIKKNSEEAFYKAKCISQVTHKDLPKRAKNLRKKGFGLLSAEIENLCVDKAFLSEGQKLDLNKVYEMHERIHSGKPLASFFNLTELQDFLTPILS